MAAIDRMLCQAAEHFLYIGTEEIFMSVSYKKLWKLLIDKDIFLVRIAANSHVLFGKRISVMYYA